MRQVKALVDAIDKPGSPFISVGQYLRDRDSRFVALADERHANIRQATAGLKQIVRDEQAERASSEE